MAPYCPSSSRPRYRARRMEVPAEKKSPRTRPPSWATVFWKTRTPRPARGAYDSGGAEDKRVGSEVSASGSKSSGLPRAAPSVANRREMQRRRVQCGPAERAEEARLAAPGGESEGGAAVCGRGTSERRKRRYQDCPPSQLRPE